MTSTGFNVGLANEKSSSRVLRPPGGGHSDIFGLKENHNDLVTPSKKKNYPQSTISSCFNMVDEPKEKETQPKEAVQEDDLTNGNVEQEKHEVDNGIDENRAPSDEEKEQEPEKKEEIVSAPRRGRVPPGGYSSGLW